MLLLLGTAGCSSFQDEAPPVPDSVMVEVLAELHLVDARTRLVADVPPALRDSVLTLYGLDSTEYGEALHYYAERPEVFGDLYGRVVDRLSSGRVTMPDQPAPPPP